MTLIPQDSLDWLVGLLREGRAYYRHAVAHTQDAEVRRALDQLRRQLLLPPARARVSRKRTKEEENHSLCLP